MKMLLILSSVLMTIYICEGALPYSREGLAYNRDGLLAYHRAGAGPYPLWARGVARGAVALRPGASFGSLSRPNWSGPPRHVASASRPPYVLYKEHNTPHRYQKPAPGSGSKLVTIVGQPQWGKRPGPAVGSPAVAPGPGPSPAYDFVRLVQPALYPLRVDGDSGPIHTIPAPNLSLANKPIVVAESGRPEDGPPKPSKFKYPSKHTYEVTEHNHEGATRPGAPALPQPLALSHSPLLSTSLTSPELLQLVRNAAQQQLADTYTLPILQQPQLLRHTALGPQFNLQGFNAVLQPTVGSDPNVLQQSVLFKPDPSYVDKIQSEFYRFSKNPSSHYGANRIPAESAAQLQIYQLDKQKENESDEGVVHYNVVRATGEGSYGSLEPKGFQHSNQVLEKTHNSSDENAQEIASATNKVETSTKAKEIETMKSEVEQSVFYSQTGQNVGDAGAFFSALTGTRPSKTSDNIGDEQSMVTEGADNKTVSPQIASDLKPYFIQNTLPTKEKINEDSFAPVHGVPFSKNSEETSDKVFYSFIAPNHPPPISDEDSMGIVVTSQLQTHQRPFSNEYFDSKLAKSNHAPLRVYVPEHHVGVARPTQETIEQNNSTAVDPKTGKPVVRIYASYDIPDREKEVRHGSSYNTYDSNRGNAKMHNSTLSSAFDDWKSSTGFKASDKTSSGADINQISEFGLKLKPRIDDYETLIEID